MYTQLHSHIFYKNILAHAHLSVRAHTHTCTRTLLHIQTHTHTHTHTLALSCIYKHTHTHTLALSCTYKHTHTHSLSLAHLNTHTHSCSLLHIQTHTHTHSEMTYLICSVPSLDSSTVRQCGLGCLHWWGQLKLAWAVLRHQLIGWDTCTTQNINCSHRDSKGTARQLYHVAYTQMFWM